MRSYDQVLTHLKRLIDKKCVPSCLLIHGPVKSRKKELAAAFAGALMGPGHPERITTHNHPDYHLYRPEGKSHQHSMARMQELLSDAQMPPYEAPCKVYTLSDAERMPPASSNALLKTLEEPTHSTYFLLLTTDINSILPTIRSRAWEIAIEPTLSQEYAPSETLKKLLDNHKKCDAPSWQKWLDALDKEVDALDESERPAYTDRLLEQYAESFRQKNLLKALERVQIARDALHHNLRVKTVFEQLLN